MSLFESGAQFASASVDTALRRVMKLVDVTPSVDEVHQVPARQIILALERAAERLQMISAVTSEFTPEERRLAHTMPALPLMQRAARTYEERRAVYGPSEQRFGAIANAMFPGGLRLEGHEDWVRFGLLMQVISKLARYDFHDPHIDSIHDVGPYSSMLEAEDRRLKGMEPFDP